MTQPPLIWERRTVEQYNVHSWVAESPKWDYEVHIEWNEYGDVGFSALRLPTNASVYDRGIGVILEGFDTVDECKAACEQWHAERHDEFKRMLSDTTRILNLGASVQGTTVALMGVKNWEYWSCSEPLPYPAVGLIDYAIFADTQGEPRAVYSHLEWLETQTKKWFPILRPTRGNLSEAAITKGTGLIGEGYKRAGKARFISLLFFLLNKETGEVGVALRHCTATLEKEKRFSVPLVFPLLSLYIVPCHIDQTVDVISRLVFSKLRYQLRDSAAFYPLGQPPFHLLILSFGEQLRSQRTEAWKECNRRLYSRITPNVRSKQNDPLGSTNLDQPLYDRLDLLRGDLPSWFGGCRHGEIVSDVS
jgi:hypothetical protein